MWYRGFFHQPIALMTEAASSPLPPPISITLARSGRLVPQDPSAHGDAQALANCRPSGEITPPPELADVRSVISEFLMIESFGHPTIEPNAPAEVFLKIDKKLQFFRARSPKLSKLQRYPVCRVYGVLQSSDANPCQVS